MVINSPDITTLDFEVLVDISVVQPTIRFVNQSAGTNLAGCAWIMDVKAGGIPVHQGNFATPDRTGVWTNYTIPELLPQPGRNIIWGNYTFSVTVKDSAGTIFPLIYIVRIDRPNGNETGSNYGKADFDITTRCELAKLYAEDRTNVSYQRSEVPYLTISRTFTLAFPATEQGQFPAPKILTDFSNALIPFSANGPGYTAIEEIVVQYQLSDNIFLQVKYKDKKGFEISCNYDLCKLQCEYDVLVASAEDKCDSGLTQKLLLINAKINQALIGKMQPLCGIDVGKLIDEIKEIGGFTCDCNCGGGVTPLLNTPGSNVDCNSLLTCLNTLLEQADPKCLANGIQWNGLSLLGKLQLIINGAASTCSSAPCYTVTDVDGTLTP